jgi:hypothetical protein
LHTPSDDDRPVSKKPVGLLVVCLVVALAFPALASALRRTYFGPAAGGVNNAGVEISARLTNGKAVKVKRIEWHNVVGSCAGGRQGASTGEFPDAIKVKHGSFSATGHINSGRTTVIVSGTFKHHATKVAGKLRIRGVVPGCAGLDTGTVDWHAKQPAGEH